LLRFVPAPAARLLRKALLSYGRRMDPARMLQRSAHAAVHAVIAAGKHSAAYRVLLQEQGVTPDMLGPEIGWARLPILTKANTFERFALHELARPVQATALADVLTSSGRSGRSFGFRLTGRKQHETSWFDIDLGLQDMFGVDSNATLLVNCLPMGVVFRSRAVTVANVSVREDMACSILRDVGPRFAQTLVCADPLFIRRLLDEGRRVGVDWSALNTSVIMGEEVLVEAQRDYIAARMGIDLDNDQQRTIGSSFGVGELGLNLFFETRETIRMRRAWRAEAHQAAAVVGMRDDAAGLGAIPSLFCFNPLRCFVEILNPDADGFGELCITMLDRHALIPLPRYATGDLGKLITREASQSLAAMAASAAPWLPVVAVCGRIQDRPVDMPSVEAIKELIYIDHAIADQLSGAFKLAHQPFGQRKLTLQAHSAATVDLAALGDKLRNLKAGTLLEGLILELVAAHAFDGRPLLDYERKFPYAAQDNMPVGP
jgi:phenylacetate-CoA ligase